MMSRGMKYFGFLAVCCLWMQAAGANPLPPPTVSLLETSQVTATADLFDNPVFGSTANGGPDLLVRQSGYSFVTFWNSSDKLCLARRYGTGAWKILTFTDTLTSQDSHRYPAVAVSPNDGRIHLSFDHGGGTNTLRYKISSAGAATVSDTNFKTSLFGATRNYLSSGQTLTYVAYPNFEVRESDNKLYMVWRQWASGDTNQSQEWIATYNDNGTWTTRRIVVSGSTGTGTYVDVTGTYPDSPSRKAYGHGFTSAGGDLYYTWTWAEQPYSSDINHDLMYLKSSDGGVTWRNTAGSSVSLPATLNSTGINAPWTLDYNWRVVVNRTPTATDSAGNTHIAMAHNQNGAGTPQRCFHYRRIGTTWSRFELPSTAPTAMASTILIDRTYDTIYLVGGSPIRIWAAQKYDENYQENDPLWGVWSQRYLGTQTYVGRGTGRIALDGTVLFVPAQRTGTGNSSRLDYIRFSLNPNP